MTFETPHFQAIVERLEKLEKQNRRLKQGAGFTLIAALMLACQVPPKARVIET